MIKVLAAEARDYAGPALAVRLGPPLLAVAGALALVLCRQDLATERLAGAIGLVAAFTLVVPREPFPTLVLVGLGADYAIATARYQPDVRGVSALVAIVVLYAIHSAYGLSAGLRLRVGIDPVVFRRLYRRIGETLAFALPAAALTTLLGRHQPTIAWVGAVALVLAMALAATPLFFLHRR